MYILVLSKIEVVQEQKKVDRKYWIGQKDCSGLSIPFYAKKTKKTKWTFGQHNTKK